MDFKKSRNSIVHDNYRNGKNPGTCKEIHKEEELKYLLGEKWFTKRNVQVQWRMDSRSTCQHVASRLDSVSDSKAQASLYLKRHEGI